MKLLSHNMLKSCCKGVKTGYPLRILVIMMGAAHQPGDVECCCFFILLQPVKVEVKTVNFEPEFISRMIPKLEWSVLKTAAESVRDYINLMCSHNFQTAIHSFRLAMDQSYLTSSQTPTRTTRHSSKLPTTPCLRWN